MLVGSVVGSILLLSSCLYSTGIVIDQIVLEKIEPLSFQLNATYQIVLIYRNLTELETANPFRIKTSSNNTNRDLPIMVVAQQETQVTAWSVPLVVETSVKDNVLYFNDVAKIMCHDYMENIIHPAFSVLPLRISQSFIIALSTASPTDVTVDVELEEETSFFVNLDQTHSVSVSPSQPKYVFYRFDENTTDTVVIEVESNDQVCLTVSIQDSRCPVFDMNKDIKYEGIHQTINLKGAITLRKNKYRDGFFLVFVAKPDNFECSQESSYLPRNYMRSVQVAQTNITTNITFVIRSGISYNEYLIAIGGTVLVLLAAGLVLGFLAAMFNRFGTVSHNRYNDIIVTDYFEELSTEQVKALFNTENLNVSYLARHPMRIKKRSYNYLSHILSIALFYSIPVVQLVVTYQRIVNVTGNEDMCYYNFLCAHPAMGFSDFNHIYSNIGYAIFGVMFILVVVDRHYLINMRKEKGIPVHYGLYHAMGVALIIEGILSACYHICPSQSNYQFDTSFMYIMAVLSMIKLYQNRHPDINATAYTTFTILGAAIFMGRFVLLVIANVCNYGMLGTGLYLYSANVTDFGTFLLALLMGNAVIHTGFYTFMKLIHHERICFEAICYGILGLIAWISSGIFFLDAATLWTVTPAESRQWNQACILLNFFDKHDVWHLLSAPALYFTFMFLMCLDDDIIDKPHNEIPVF